MTGRDARGRFTTGNLLASSGGLARAAALTPERRSAIARAGWLALVDRRFAGDAQRAAAWLGALGAWAADQVFAGTPMYKPDVFRHPGPCPKP